MCLRDALTRALSLRLYLSHTRSLSLSVPLSTPLSPHLSLRASLSVPLFAPLSTPLSTRYNVEFLHGHGQVSEKNYRDILSACPETVLRSGSGMSAACNATLKQMNDNLG